MMNPILPLSSEAEYFAGCCVAVMDLATTGLATARILSERGAIVTIYDSKPEDKLDPARVAEAKEIPGVRLALGTGEPDWEQTNLVVPSPHARKWDAPAGEAFERDIAVWSELEVAYRLAKAPILGIMGTNGRTTTTALVGAICREAGLNTWVAGNIAEDEDHYTPLIVAAAECPADGVIVAEVSSFQLSHVHTFRPKVAAWLNMSADHLNLYQRMAHGQKMAKMFACQTEDDFRVINLDGGDSVRFYFHLDEDKWKYFFQSVKGQSRLTSATDPENFGQIKHDFEYDEESGFLTCRIDTATGYWNQDTQQVIDYPPEQVKEPVHFLHDSEIQRPDIFTISNILVAAAMANCIGLNFDVIRRAVKSFYRDDVPTEAD